MSKFIITEITSCRECPHLQREQYLTESTFDSLEFNWFCGKSGGREIAKYVESGDKPEIPDWCPLPNHT